MNQAGLAPGAMIEDTYCVVRQLGRGGMGTVYEAVHEVLGKRVAIKVLRLDDALDSDAIAHFRREAKVASRLKHPGIVGIDDFREPKDGYPYLVMELIPGVSLAEIIKQGAPLQLARVMDFVAQLASALTAVHECGIVHLDLKPANVIVSPGPVREQLKVVDFGIAKVMQGSQQATSPNLAGTLPYMAPERFDPGAHPLDAKADQFSLAVMIYEMLAGRRPFEGESAPEIINRILHEEPRPLVRTNGEVSAELARVIKRAMAKDPAHRFASVSEFARRVAESVPVATEEGCRSDAPIDALEEAHGGLRGSVWEPGHAVSQNRVRHRSIAYWFGIGALFSAAVAFGIFRYTGRLGVHKSLEIEASRSEERISPASEPQRGSVQPLASERPLPLPAVPAAEPKSVNGRGASPEPSGSPSTSNAGALPSTNGAGRANPNDGRTNSRGPAASSKHSPSPGSRPVVMDLGDRNGSDGLTVQVVGDAGVR